MADAQLRKAKLFALLTKRKEAKKKLLGPSRMPSNRNWYPERTGEHRRALSRHRARGYVGNPEFGAWRMVAAAHYVRTVRTNSISLMASTKLVRTVGAVPGKAERIRAFPSHLPTMPMISAMREIFGISKEKAIRVARTVVKRCSMNRGVPRETIVREVLGRRALARRQEINLSSNKTYLIYLSPETVKKINEVYGQAEEPPTLDQIMDIAETWGYDRVLHSMV